MSRLNIGFLPGKSLHYPESHRSILLPSDEGGGFALGEDGGRERKSDSLPSLFAMQKSSPLVRGGLRCISVPVAIIPDWDGGGADDGKKQTAPEGLPFLPAWHRLLQPESLLHKSGG